MVEMNSKFPAWIALLVGLAATVAATTNADAADAQRAPTITGALRGCSRPSGPARIVYSALFRWSEPATRAASPMAMRLRMGKAPFQAQPFAELSTLDGRCVARCQVTGVEWHAETRAPRAADLSCASEGLSPFRAEATLFWPDRPGRGPVLRFGSWLTGYRPVALAVEVDRFGVPALGASAGVSVARR